MNTTTYLRWSSLELARPLLIYSLTKREKIWWIFTKSRKRWETEEVKLANDVRAFEIPLSFFFIHFKSTSREWSDQKILPLISTSQREFEFFFIQSTNDAKILSKKKWKNIFYPLYAMKQTTRCVSDEASIRLKASKNSLAECIITSCLNWNEYDYKKESKSLATTTRLNENDW